MAVLLGIDTGGTYTDAVLLDAAETTVLASAKSLTTRPDLALGVGRAIDAVLAQAGVSAADVALVSLSTTLATNALVEGQGGRVALAFIGFDAAELTRAGLTEALRGDPVIALAGGHDHAGVELAPLDLAALSAALDTLGPDITGFAVAASFATRNPGHERSAHDLILSRTGKPVTCSHELSASLGGPKRALTAVLNARLIGLITRLIDACQAHMTLIGITARLMVVRGDGALISAELARDRPIETILSGPAASVAGASWLTGEPDALVSDIGGTTTDVCLLRHGKPAIDPQGARVGPYRTMVEAVAMRTTGLGGDSEVHLLDGLEAGLRLGPKRLLPVSLLAMDHPALVHRALDAALAANAPPDGAGRFVVPLFGAVPAGLDPREAAVALRLTSGPLKLSDALHARTEGPALARLVARGLAMIAGLTPSDAAHQLGKLGDWDARAAEKALILFGRKRAGRGERIAADPTRMAQLVIDQLTAQTVDCLLDAAFAEDGRDFGAAPDTLTRHGLTRAGLDRHSGIIVTHLTLGVPVIGLGASAPAYYGAVGDRLGARMILPAHAGVANAIGAVVGQVAMTATGTVTSPAPGAFIAHLPGGPQRFTAQDLALAALELALTHDATAAARAAGVEDIRLSCDRDIRQVTVEGHSVFIEARLRVAAQGRPRIARG